MSGAHHTPTPAGLHPAAERIRQIGRDLGFDQVGFTGVELRRDEAHLLRWLALERHGEMQYMARHGTRRTRPAELVAGTRSVISVRMDYLPEHAQEAQQVLEDPNLGYVSRYALGRDYHKVLRKRLARLASEVADLIGTFGYRVFVDSAPVLEKALARNAGLGWIGKHTNLINKQAGSWFFLGEIYTDLQLGQDPPAQAHCGSCTACIEVCPTQAIVAPYELDATRCISYLTIEQRGPIPEALRKPMGNRIYGCDDCQLFCPWNKFAQFSREADFTPRHTLDASTLPELFGWSESQFLRRTEGSAIRRIGYVSWLRNIAVALGNAPTGAPVLAALKARQTHPEPLVREHVAWALEQHNPGEPGSAGTDYSQSAP